MPDETRKIEITERPEVPWLSVIFGYGPASTFVVGALAAWLVPAPWRVEAILLSCVWASSILAFLAGVRRGLSFRTEGGPALAQIATMFCLFVLALAALVAVMHGRTTLAIAIDIIGFAAIMVLDPVAARKGQAPLSFARLRPPQMAIVLVSLIALFVRSWQGV